ncbi:hypothetical protein KM043_007771 [Ampulex compressa]|nr:hypothetical protein KM043_007771 [Ampulex compressa]
MSRTIAYDGGAKWKGTTVQKGHKKEGRWEGGRGAQVHSARRCVDHDLGGVNPCGLRRGGTKKTRAVEDATASGECKDLSRTLPSSLSRLMRLRR